MFVHLWDNISGNNAVVCSRFVGNIIEIIVICQVILIALLILSLSFPWSIAKKKQGKKRLYKEEEEN